MLREAGDARGTAPAPTLATDLDGLLRRTRAGGLRVRATVGVDPAELPPLVSREAYRIVQEALSNALRHGGDGAPVTLRVALAGPGLTVTAENPLPGRSPAARTGGGHGLRGITDRARLLGGTAEAGPAGDVWRLTVRLPLT